MKQFGISQFAALMIATASVSATPVLAYDSAHTGKIIFTGLDFCPSGWIPAEGQILPLDRHKSGAFWPLLGTTFGGDGRITFGVPNLKGRVPVGAGEAPEHNTLGVASWEPFYKRGGALETAATLTTLGATPGNYCISLNPTTYDNPYISEIMMYAGKECPAGWLNADGRMMQVSENPDLHGVIQNIYGGDNVTEFALPDLRSRAPIGSGQTPEGNEITVGTASEEMQDLKKSLSEVTHVFADIIPTFAITFCIAATGRVPTP